MAVTRISGIASGMDTDQMVKDLMKAESARLDKVKKSQTYVSWQQEAYRDVISKIKDLQAKYFDTLSPSKNISSSSSFGRFSYNVTSGGVASTAVEITANADIKSRTLTIDSITQLATKDTMSGVKSGIKGITTSGFDFNAFKTSMGTDNFDMNLLIGSNSKKIEITQTELSGINNSTEFVAALNTKIAEAFGSNYNNLVSEINGEISIDKSGSVVRVADYTSATSLSALGLTSGQSNIDYQSKTLKDLFGLTDSDLGTLLINGKSVSLSEEDTYATMMDKINKSNAGISLNYDSLSDKFSLESTTEGSVNNIEIASGSNTEVLFSKLFGVTDFSDPNFVHEEGKNAVLSINGTEVVQDSNLFSFEGVTYNLKAVTASAIDVSVNIDKTPIIDNIKNFVSEYNQLIDDISTKYSEKKYYSYEPLTDDERDALSEDEIKKWEDKAKSGVIRSSSELDAFLSKLRNALVEPVEGVGISLSSIGITSASYTDKGKLYIDETKLSENLENNFDSVVKLFSQQSDETYLNGNASVRYKESGIGARLDDIMKDYTRTTRDENGNKGILVNKAGLINDSSVINNELTKKLLEYDTRINSLEDYLADKESSYYSMFSAMETAMSKLQSQADSLVNMLGS
ncbi:flagellar filament capping protein FliD [Fusibacter bizertensis]|uniref:Flagellar hook-associated protein 2 n=1 Tax=Fusibacter bizertensis TaxID=1488331 RepID=A0ABT6NDW4_9FIRM|nr:flagellar filament capping protein FliD [Fusibacter bizertensis]MDH8678605.1 flagellar filament capping protein FliD [Fusibacter bizertensis]